MILEPTLTERQLINQFLEARRELLDVHADLDRWDREEAGAGRYKAQIDLRVEGKFFVLLIEAQKVHVFTGRPSSFLAVHGGREK